MEDEGIYCLNIEIKFGYRDEQARLELRYKGTDNRSMLVWF